MKDFIKKLDMVSDNHNVPKEMRLEKFCDFIIKFFSTDSYKSGGFSPDIDIEKDKDYLELIAMWAEKVAKDMEQGCTADYMGRLYEQMYLLKSKASANGQFFTPESLCDLMARITEKDDAELNTTVVNDCACGSGRTLLAHFMKVTNEDRANAGRYYYDAADIDLFTCKMCACNMMIHGMQGKVVCQDQLLLPTPTAIFYINEVRYPFPTTYYSIRVRYPKQEEEERKVKEGKA